MTIEARHAKAMQAFKAMNEARAAFYAARMDYAKALGRGDATREQRLAIVALGDAYERAAA